MVFFRKINGHMDLATDLYNPTYAVETFKITRVCECDCEKFLMCLSQEDWDNLFLLMMEDCPEEVVVDHESRDDALVDVFGLEQAKEIKHRHEDKIKKIK
jgi:hypothetical protein